jgi:hypothetical protein
MLCIYFCILSCYNPQNESNDRRSNFGVNLNNEQNVPSTIQIDQNVTNVTNVQHVSIDSDNKNVADVQNVINEIHLDIKSID